MSQRQSVKSAKPAAEPPLTKALQQYKDTEGHFSLVR
jgi:hypothetical protein